MNAYNYATQRQSPAKSPLAYRKVKFQTRKGSVASSLCFEKSTSELKQ